MNNYDVCYLIGAPKTRGLYDESAVTERRVFCEIRSVGMRENYTAMSAGFLPEFVVVLSNRIEYKQERTLRHKDTLYTIIRVYIRDDDAVELTVQRSEGNV